MSAALAPLLDRLRPGLSVYVPGATVWNLTREREIGVSVAGAAHILRAERVIVATGALERPFPIRGWTLPGVMTAGAGQILLKSSGLVPDGREKSQCFTAIEDACQYAIAAVVRNQ